MPRPLFRCWLRGGCVWCRHRDDRRLVGWRLGSGAHRCLPSPGSKNVRAGPGCTRDSHHSGSGATQTCAVDRANGYGAAPPWPGSLKTRRRRLLPSNGFPSSLQNTHSGICFHPLRSVSAFRVVRSSLSPCASWADISTRRVLPFLGVVVRPATRLRLTSINRPWKSTSPHWSPSNSCRSRILVAFGILDF